MKEIKIDFTVDVFSKEKIPMKEIKEKIKEEKPRKNNNYFLSELADFYYREKYNMEIIDVLGKFYDIPVCPITGNYVSYKFGGSIKFGTYSSDCNWYDVTKHISKNNEKHINHVKKMKFNRKGEGNPMYNKTPWNKNLNKFNSLIIKKISDDRINITFSEETLKKMSESAKKRKIHGHSGCSHSEETKQLLREKTIKRLKNSEFPQTRSYPHKVVLNILEGEGIDFNEEEEVGGYVFDFLVYDDILLEVQGDYWHCNPNTKFYIPKSKAQIKNVERDKRKKEYINKNTNYNLYYIWEYDIVNNKKNVELWLKSLKK